MDDIARFPAVRPQRHALSYALKQLVSHEIDLQRMRREEPPQPPPQPRQRPPRPVAKESRKADSSAAAAVASQQPAAAGEQQKEGEEAGEEEATATPRHLQRLQVCHSFINSISVCSDINIYCFNASMTV